MHAVTFDPKIHTPEMMRNQITDLTEQGALLIGSLGRATIYGLAEFNARHESPYKHTNGNARDIDVLTLHRVINKGNGAYPVDDLVLRGLHASLSIERGAWVLRQPDKGFVAEIDEELLAPIAARTIDGTACLTLRPAVQLGLIGILGARLSDRALRDRSTRNRLFRAMPLGERALWNSPAMEPFRTVRRMNASLAGRITQAA